MILVSLEGPLTETRQAEHGHFPQDGMVGGAGIELVRANLRLVWQVVTGR